MIEYTLNHSETGGFNLYGGQILVLLPQGCGRLSEDSRLEAQKKFYTIGYELLFIEGILKNIQDDILSYFMPDIRPGSVPSMERVRQMIQEQMELPLESPTAIKGDYFATTIITSEEGGESGEVFLEMLFLSLESRIKNRRSEKRLTIRKRESRNELLIGACYIPEADSECRSLSLPLPEEKRDPSGEEYSIETLIEELHEMNQDKLREIGLSEDALRFLLGAVTPKLSPVRITRHSDIILDDYSGLEIKMDDKTKALYFLYLRHPEGIAIKDLPTFRNELMDLYQSISGRGDLQAMNQTIDNLVDPFQNNSNISLSRIKKAFIEAFSKTIAEHYYVDGERGGVRRISLDRNLVIWETIRHD